MEDYASMNEVPENLLMPSLEFLIWTNEFLYSQRKEERVRISYRIIDKFGLVIRCILDENGYRNWDWGKLGDFEDI